MVLFDWAWRLLSAARADCVLVQNHCSGERGRSLLRVSGSGVVLAIAWAALSTARGAGAVEQQGTAPSAPTVAPTENAGNTNWLGVWLRTPTVGEVSEGLTVEWIAAGSPAAGRIEPGDVVIDLDGQETHTLQAAREAFENRNWDDGVSLTVRRHNRILCITAHPVPIPTLRPFAVVGRFVGERYTGNFNGFLDPVARTAIGTMHGSGAGSVDVTFTGPWDTTTGNLKLALRGHVRMLFTVALHGVATGTIDASGKGSGRFEGGSGLGSERGTWDCSSDTPDAAEL